MKPVAPYDNLIVTLEKKFYDSVTFSSGVKIDIDPSWHPEEYTMMRAKVISVPLKILPTYYNPGMTLTMKEGDEVLIRYDVVFSYLNQPDNDSPVYKNALYLDGKEYWRCAIDKVFAIYRGDEFEMINGWVMCDATIEVEKLPDIKVVVPADMKQELNVATRELRKTRKDKLTVKYIGEPLKDEPKLNVKAGDTIFTNEKIVQTYEIDLEKFYIIRQSHILGKLIA